MPLVVVCVLLDSSILFAEPYVSYPVGPLPLLTRPLLATPSSTARLAYPTTFVAIARRICNHAPQRHKRCHLLTQHPTEWSPLAPRIMKTLFLALVSASKSRGTREGAIRGLVGVGKDGIRKGVHRGTP